MGVAIKVPRPAPQTRPGSMRVVSEKQPPFRTSGIADSDPRAFLRRLEPRQFEDAIGVVITSDQPLSASQGLKDLRATRPVCTGCKIAEMPDLIVSADNVVPTLDQSRVVIID